MVYLPLLAKTLATTNIAKNLKNVSSYLEVKRVDRKRTAKRPRFIQCPAAPFYLRLLLFQVV